MYYYGREAVLDILNFRIIKLRKYDGNLIELKELFQNKLIPNMPVKADLLMNKYQIPEGKQLGTKLKIIEKQWVDNNFKISEQQVDNIVKN